MNGELKDYTNQQLSEVSKRLPFSKGETETLTKTAWDLATEYIQRLKPEDYRGPSQVAVASLVLASDVLGWSVEKKYELVRSIDINLFAYSICNEMNRELDRLSPRTHFGSTDLSTR